MISYSHKTPFGIWQVKASENAITALSIIRDEKAKTSKNQNTAPQIIKKLIKHIDAYCYGENVNFDYPLAPQGTEFQNKVWQELIKIPSGETLTYGDIAKKINKPKASRAVGNACNKNPIAILIPCHRVVGSTGNITGYAYGTDLKQRLLDHEADLLFSKTSIAS